MYLFREQSTSLTKLLTPNKVIVILGARRIGKTTLLNDFLKNIKEKYLFVQGDDIASHEYLSSQSIAKLQGFVGENKLLIIDEAQKIPNIGINLKLIVDHIENIKVIATGSSTFDLLKNIGEPLTGRKFTLRLFPIAQIELKENLIETQSNLENRLIFGSYPEIILTKDNQKQADILKEIVNSYLFKDILELDGIRNSKKIASLAQMIAFQIGKEVSYAEIGMKLGMSKNTVEKYLDLLEQTFVIFRLDGFSRNLRKEITKNPRYYFYDNGIRNALINNFNPLNIRDDIGMLWENYIINERIKKQEYQKIYSNNYFWRTYDQKEIDWIEEREGKLFGYEIKWNKNKIKPPKDWLETYTNSSYEVITKDNYLEFIS
ncbi:MAG: ATP-binding protein [Candidatus Moraniibacteriota bacterium]